MLEDHNISEGVNVEPISAVYVLILFVILWGLGHNWHIIIWDSCLTRCIPPNWAVTLEASINYLASFISTEANAKKS